MIDEAMSSRERDVTAMLAEQIRDAVCRAFVMRSG